MNDSLLTADRPAKRDIEPTGSRTSSPLTTPSSLPCCDAADADEMGIVNRARRSRATWNRVVLLAWTRWSTSAGRLHVRRWSSQRRRDHAQYVRALCFHGRVDAGIADVRRGNVWTGSRRSIDDVGPSPLALWSPTITSFGGCGYDRSCGPNGTPGSKNVPAIGMIGIQPPHALCVDCHRFHAAAIVGEAVDGIAEDGVHRLSHLTEGTPHPSQAGSTPLRRPDKRLLRTIRVRRTHCDDRADLHGRVACCGQRGVERASRPESPVRMSDRDNVLDAVVLVQKAEEVDQLRHRSRRRRIRGTRRSASPILGGTRRRRSHSPACCRRQARGNRRARSHLLAYEPRHRSPRAAVTRADRARIREWGTGVEPRNKYDCCRRWAGRIRRGKYRGRACWRLR